MKKSIVFIQLPLLDHSYSYIHGNIDYAPTALAAYIRKYFPNKAQTVFLPQVLSQFGSDTLIAEYIQKIKPDIICFTNYLWNCERHLSIAEQVKKDIPSVLILFGGPEIHAGSFLLKNHQSFIDYFIKGEGEWFFDIYFTSGLPDYITEHNSNALVTQPFDDLKPVDHICEPYTNKFLNSMIDGSIYIELTRGCPYRCSYCNYSKNYYKVRELPFDIVTRVLREPGDINEIYILSPTFNKSKDFKRKLQNLADMRHGVKLHTEMRASGITPATARLLYRAGFRSLEVGLQTYSKQALKNINRDSSPLKEIKGMKALVEAGIDLKIGIIPALPGDTPEGFKETVDILVKNGLGDYIEYYPLMLLPGTAIRDMAAEHEYIYQEKPPYYVISNRKFSFHDMRDMRLYIEQQTGFSHSLFDLPDLSINSNGLYNRGAAFNGDSRDRWDMFQYQKLVQTNVFTFFITVSNVNSVYENLAQFLQNAPRHELFNIVFTCDEYIDEDIFTDVLARIKSDNFYSRLHIYSDWQEGLRFRFYQLITNPELFNRAFDSYQLIAPVLRLTKNNFADLSGSDETRNMFIPHDIYPSVKKYLVEKYTDAQEMLSFEMKADQADFFSAIDFEFVDLPFEFRVVTVG